MILAHRLPKEETMMARKKSSEKTVQDIRLATRKRYSAEEKIRIVIDGLRGEDSVAELCRREGINPNVYYRWSKEFLEAGKKRLAGDTAREATKDEVKNYAQKPRPIVHAHSVRISVPHRQNRPTPVFHCH